MLLYFRALGRMPFSRDESGSLSFSVFSWATLYGAVALGTQLVLSFYSSQHSVLAPSLLDNFDSFVRSVMGLLYINFVFHGIVNWIETPALARVATRWSQVQMHLDFVTKKRHNSVLLAHPSRALGVVCLTSFFLEYLPAMKTSGETDPLILLLYCSIVQYLILLYWALFVFTHLVSSAADLIRESLVDVLLGGATVAQVRSRRDAWLALQSWALDFTAAMSWTLQGWVLSKYVLFVLSLYAAAVFFLSSGSVWAVPGYTYLPLLATSSFLHICIEAHKTDQKMGRDFEVAILSCDIQHFPEDVAEEIKMMLSCIEVSEERFNLQGIVELKKSTILKMIEVSLTYLVVLIQFKHSIKNE